MPQMTPYPTAKTTPSRKQRKAMRNKIYLQNKHTSSAYTKRARKEARRAAANE